MYKLLHLAYFLFFFTFFSYGQTVFINEVRYLVEDSADRGVEIVNLSDTDLAGWELILYNSSGMPYGTIDLAGSSILTPNQDESNVIIFVDIMMLSINSGSGIVLRDANGHIVQYLSYCGEQAGQEGPAAGMTATNIGCQEGNNTPQLIGEGYELNNFDWTVNTLSPGDINIGQLFITAPNTAPFLPVEWVSFTATSQKTGILLEWVTGTEEDNQHFILERSQNGRDFEVVEYIESQGQSSHTQYYEFLDAKAARGINYYRISQKDFSGEIETYKIIEARLAQHIAIQIYPNPVVNDVVVDLPIIDEAISIEIFDVVGKRVFQTKENANNGLLNLNLASLNTGTYILVVNTATEVFSQKLVKR